MSTDPSALPRRFLRPCLLLLLRENASYGYDLLERLRALGFERRDAGSLYRALRALESEGLVRSAWERSAVGPERRIYELTRAGMEELHSRAKELADVRVVLDVFLSRYGEFVALERPRKEASARR